MQDFILILLNQILPFIPLAIGVSISYNIMKATDLTLDGSFVGGAGIFALLVTHNYSTILAIIIATIFGAMCGVVTGLIQINNKIDSLLAGILSSFMLLSLNLIIMGKPNISLINYQNYYTDLINNQPIYADIFLSIILALGIILLYFILTGSFGLKLRASGQNYTLVKRLGINVELYKISGFALTNALAAISGIISAQQFGYADTSMGTGMTLSGIAAIIIGYELLSRFNLKIKSLFFEASSTILGIILYFSAINLLLKFDLNPLYLKLVLSVILIIFMRLSPNSRTT